MLAYSALILLGAALASTGLALRVPARTVPSAILSTSGTLGGFIIGAIIAGLGIGFTQWWLWAVGTGVVAFALGATLLTAVNRARTA